MKSEREIAKQIEQLEVRWIETYLEVNIEGFADLLTEDFIYTSERGVFDKKTYVENLVSGVIEMRELSNSDHEVRIPGDTAVSTGASRLETIYEGEGVSGTDRFIRIWVDEGEGLRAAALHANQVTEDDA
ncbi:hypothetical protein BH24ACT22_BH24ACT22_09740 [soil metagenome]